MGSECWRRRAVLRYEGERCPSKAHSCPAATPTYGPTGPQPLSFPRSPQLKDLKRQLHLERKRADKLQERLQDILTNSKSRSGEGPRRQGRLRCGEAELGSEGWGCFLYFTLQGSPVSSLCLLPFLCVCPTSVSFFLSFFKLIYLFIYFGLHWVFVAARGLSLVVASSGYSLLWSMGFSLQWLLLLRSTGSRHVGFSSCGTWAQ